MHLVFVYGTLKRGQLNHKLLYPIQPIFGVAQGFDIHAGPQFPFAIKGQGRIKGEVYEVDDKTLALLDKLEGVPTLYQRVKAKVITYKGDLECWIYVSDLAKQHPIIASGEW